MKKKILVFICFAAYSLIMLWLLFGQRIGFAFYDNYLEQLKTRINLIPFRTVAEYVGMYQTNVTSLVNHAIVNIGGNVATFVPLGIFLPLLWDKFNNAKVLLLHSTIIIFSVEIIQYFTLLGSFDIDDYILNILGIFIGFWCCRLVQKIKK